VHALRHIISVFAFINDQSSIHLSNKIRLSTVLSFLLDFYFRRIYCRIAGDRRFDSQCRVFNLIIGICSG
jgi:hypothetical protein